MSFDKRAAQWDTERRIKRSKELAGEIRKFLSKDHYERAMEFGCGTGLITFNLFDLFGQVDLVDSSQGMIEVVEEKIRDNGVENAKGINIDLSSSSREESKYDLIYSSMVLHHIVDTRGILSKLSELLNEGGELCIVDLDKEDGSFHKNYPDFDGHNGFCHEELQELVEEIGYEDINIRTFYHGVKDDQEEKVEYSLFMLKGVRG